MSRLIQLVQASAEAGDRPLLLTVDAIESVSLGNGEDAETSLIITRSGTHYVVNVPVEQMVEAVVSAHGGYSPIEVYA